MQNKNILFILIFFFIFCFFVLLKGLKNSNVYIPKSIPEKSLENFNTQNLYTEEKINSEDIFTDAEFYVLNIWASWCLPCRNEHSILMQIKKKPTIKIIGLNYKDKILNAKKFINQYGNPYSLIITDNNGTISIQLGAYGVPETYIINKEKKIIKKYIGPLDKKSLEEINYILK